MIQRTGTGIWLFLGLSGIGIGCFSAFDNFYFHGLGYSVAVIGALTATFNISLAVAELPSAVIFDRRSHWAAIQIGNGIRFVGILLFFFAFGPVGDFAGEALAGVGAAAMSGTSVAYMLNRLGPVSDHERRRALGFSAALGAGTSLIGGALGLMSFAHDPMLIWGAGAAWVGLAGIVFFIGRPRVRTLAERPTEPLSSYLAALIAISRHPRAWLSVTADAALVGPLLLWQLRLGTTSITAIFFGFAVMKAAGVLGGQLVTHRKVDGRLVLLCLACNIAAVITFASVNAAILIVLFFGIHVLLRIAVSAYCRSELHAVVDDGRRAGASSVVSLLGSLVTALAALLVGRIADAGGPLLAMIPSIALYASVGVITLASRRSAEPLESV
ncbi:hypothetical protein [Curtobacterium sp. ISL-83]|uniref:hypothetical protein n=1 Tax=Curtobacterium sp. ISL-83 TaxID=2819145 RepID=UPI001BE720E3|nr:hypothetical protein [Curtobacterium sp. ISL-83]MBT2501869.1 hypothetical protein [Curtobacterium sp. ISL-83]